MVLYHIQQVEPTLRLFHFRKLVPPNKIRHPTHFMGQKLGIFQGAADAQRFSVSPADTGSSAATVDAKDATLGKRKVADAVLSVRLRSEEPLLTSDYETSAKETVRLDDIVPPDILPQSAPSRQGGAADAQGDGICFHDAHCGISD